MSATPEDTAGGRHRAPLHHRTPGYRPERGVERAEPTGRRRPLPLDHEKRTRVPGPAGIVTSTGRGVLVAAVVLGTGAAVLRFPELGVLAVGCVSALGVGAGLVARRPELAVEIEVLPSRVRRGEGAIASITIHNIGRHASGPVRLILPHGTDATETDVGSVPPSKRRTIALPLPTGRRGVLRIGPAGLCTTDPLGLFSRYQQLGEPVRIHVHPASYPLTPLPSVRSSSPDGLPVDSRTEGGVTFHALREYVPGDDPRHLHWRSSARTGTLLVRRHVDPSEPVTAVLLDTRRHAYPDGDAGTVAFDAAVDAAASVLLACVRRRFPARLHTTAGLRVTCRGGRSDDMIVLDALAGVEWDGPAAPGNSPGRKEVVPGHDAGSQATRGAMARVLVADPLTAAVRGLGQRGVGTLALVSGGVDAAQVAATGAVVGAFERVVVIRVGRAGAATTAGGGRLRLVNIADAAELPALWPGNGPELHGSVSSRSEAI